jgi:acetyl esterase
MMLEDTARLLRQLEEWAPEGEPLTPTLAREVLERLTAFAPPRVAEVTSAPAAARGPAGDVPLRIFSPRDADPDAVLVYVHGGGWVAGHVGLVKSLAEQLARAMGCVVVAAGYRLAPEAPYPAALDDVAAAFAWVRHELLADRPATRLAALGESAGGNLVAALGLRLRAAGERGPDLQMLIYPALDPSRSSGSYERFATGYGLDAAAMAWYWSQYLGDGASGSGDPLAAPLIASSFAALAPAIVVTAGLDPLQDEGLEYARLLQRDGTRALVLHYPAMIHGFFSSSGAIARGLDAIRDVCALARAELGLATSPSAVVGGDVRSGQ